MSRTAARAPSPEQESWERVLLEEVEHRARARAHLELARLRLGRGQVEASVRHLREALLLDTGLDAATQLLRDLGERGSVTPSRGRWPWRAKKKPAR